MFEVQVPTGRPEDGKLCTVRTTSPTRESALAFALYQVRSLYPLRMFRPDGGGTDTKKYSLVSDPRVCAYVTFVKDGAQ